MDLATLIASYRGPLIGLIASWGAPWSDAIELAQDSFVEAWLHRDSCRGDWNEPARKFYRSLGASAMDEWTVFRLTGEALRQVAAFSV